MVLRLICNTLHESEITSVFLVSKNITMMDIVFVKGETYLANYKAEMKIS